MSLSNMFDNSFFEENYISDDGNKYKIKIDVATIFKAKLVSYVRQGLKIEKIAVPHSINGAFVGALSSNNGKYIFYTSSPEYLIDETMSAFDLVLSFKNWIARFLYYNKTEEEYNRIKENKQLGVEVRNKIRKDEHWTEEQGEMFAKAYYMSWKLSDTLGPEKMNEFSRKLNEYLGDLDLSNFNNMSYEEKEDVLNKYQKILEENPDLAEGLSDLMGEL